MTSELEILQDVSVKLAQARIAYMLTGSMAMNYYAEPRMTRDIDIVVALFPGQIEAVVRIFGDEYYIAPEAVIGALAHHSIFNLIHNETMIKVDCIVQKKNEYRMVEFERRQEVQIADFKVYIVSREDLIISKLDWARDSHSDTQLRDIKNLLSPEMDRVYLAHWTRKLGLSALWEECSHE